MSKQDGFIEAYEAPTRSTKSETEGPLYMASPGLIKNPPEFDDTCELRENQEMALGS
ncbi:hypothetical protein KKC1_31480 [Calderihabitans maritimus]|uniref:Uncharacterized protein n=1 Tax=Calderihabitans maritimus TaxID=1246530 RepID=A0A1Z5HWX4_9FIRM|nr:hypothetical protein KKC1_31480 [Calderihabitans maritimus]